MAVAAAAADDVRDSQEAQDFCLLTQSKEDKPLGTLCKLWSWIKFVPAVLILLPIRVLFLMLTLFAVWFVCRASCLLECCAAKAPGGSLRAHTAAQRSLLALNGLLMRLVLFCFGFWWIRVRGAPAKKGAQAPTVVANHVTLADACVIAYLLRGQLTGVARRWVTKLPFLSTLARAHHVLAVDKDKRTVSPAPAEGEIAPDSPTGLAAGDVLDKPMTSTDVIVNYQRMRAADRKLFQLLIFPEGTTKAERCLIQFRTGAFVAGLPVQPLVLRFPSRPVDISWVEGLGANLFRILTQWMNHVEAVWLDVYLPSEDEQNDPRLYADNVQHAMAAAMSLPASHVSTKIGARELHEFVAKR
eukprot:TRINITY_DN77593_c0_g1_i1.p1 TRINITY_DN77593_c0_g1~~TRINITY_DN77593_c0_g1_i1.p1  ORF type:complete len:378 (-),score=64.86 TRINITY_DN77593_c0_g1_i1:29-1099(-)